LGFIFMSSHPIDFVVYEGVVCTHKMKAVFDEHAVYRRWLEIEAALAETQAEMGIIPDGAAAEIKRKADIEALDLAEINEEFKKARHSLVPLLNVFKRKCDGNAGEFIHYGATTQDIIDTGLVMGAREATNLIYGDLRELETHLLALAEKHKSTPIVGRTHGQQALPTTFGMKTAVWISEVRRHIQRLQESAKRVFVGSLFGGVGTLAAFGTHAFGVQEGTLKRLRLSCPSVSWHTARDCFGELASVMALISTTLAKIANEIYQLQKTEFGELAEPSGKTSVGSSTMPHKRNPTRCQRVISLNRHVRHLSGVIMESRNQEHERDPRGLNAEWIAVPEVLMYTGASVRHMANIMGSLEVFPEKMLANLYIRKTYVLSEWLMFKFAPALGKMKAHEKLHHLFKAASSGERNMREVVLDDKEIKDLLTEEEISYLEHPEKYIGYASKITDRVIEQTRSIQSYDPDRLGFSDL
jgi:adenylosuccinate lyase